MPPALASVLLASVLLASVLSLALGCTDADADADADGQAESAGELTVRRGAVSPTVLLTGELAAEDSVRLVTPNVDVWPMQLRWIAEEGEQVEAGERVVQYDNSQLTGEIEALRSEVLGAANQLSQTRSEAASMEASAFFAFEEARAAFEKAKLDAALPADLAAEQEWARLQLARDKAELKMEKAREALASTREEWRAAVDVARLGLEKAERKLTRAEESIDAVALEAPRGGIFLVAENHREGRPFRSGDTVFPGMTVATLPDLSTLRVEARLFDVDDGRVVPGLGVVATLDAFPGERLPGEIVAVSTIAEEEGRSARRAFQVLADIEGVDPRRMRPGMSVKIEVASAARQGLVIPRAALSFAESSIFSPVPSSPAPSSPAPSSPAPPSPAPGEGADGEPAAAGLVARARLADGSWAVVEIGLCDAFGCLLVDGGGILGEGTRLAPAAELSLADEEGENERG